MADLDYGELRVFPGNYDEYMTAATQARERLLSDNAKKKAQIAELQQFVSRFSANASKAKQATSRAKQIDKIQLEEVKASSRVNPYIRFNQEKKLFRNVLELEQVTKGFDEGPVFKDFSGIFEVGERVAIIGQNGAGKTTLLRTLLNEYSADKGEVKWSENVKFGYYAQDHSADFEQDMTLFDWMTQWRQSRRPDSAQYFGAFVVLSNDIGKSVKVFLVVNKAACCLAKS